MDNHKNTDEITLKELLLKLIEFKKEIIKNWYWILFVSLPIAGFMYYKAASTPAQYKAELTFMVSDDEGSGMSGMAGLLGQFGFGGGGGGKSNPGKMLELLMTRKITEKALFHKVLINGEDDFLANHLISNLESNRKWTYKPWYKRLKKNKPSKLIDFRFKNENLLGFNRLENSALKKIYKFLAGEQPKLESSFSEFTGIMKISILTTEEKLSMNITQIMFDELNNFYYSKTIEKTEKHYNLLKEKTDSIFNLLSVKEYQMAQFKDNNRGLISKTSRLKESRLFRDVQILTIMYGEASKNLEIAEYSYNLKKPFIQVIDNPILPLNRISPSKLKKSILGFLLGLFFSVLFIVVRKIIIDTLY